MCYLGYGKLDRWQLLAKEVNVGFVELDHPCLQMPAHVCESVSSYPLLDADYDLRVKALELMPKLLEKLEKKASALLLAISKSEENPRFRRTTETVGSEKDSQPLRNASDGRGLPFGIIRPALGQS